MAKYLLPLTWALLASAEQPGAAAPITGPSRNLPLGQLNFLHTTDTHGWHAGHLQEGQYSADFGDYISFIQRMREKVDAVGADLIVVDTGDRVEGNGLYDASNPKGLYIYDIIKQVDYDVLSPGNHELYAASTVDAEYSKLASATKGRYLASNVDYIDPKTGQQVPLGDRYRVFETKNQGIKIAAFGFLYNFTLSSNNSVVQFVEDTLKESWFQKAIREKVDLFLVCVHMPLKEYELQTIYQAIRSQNKDTPIQVFGSHTHIRNFVKYDSKAAGLQSGRYLETIGWASINGVKNNSQFGAADEVSFHRRYIDNNILGYRYHTGLSASEFPTEHGKNTTSYITKVRHRLGLDQKYGCIPRDLYYSRSPFPGNDTIAAWMAYELLPGIAKKQFNQPNVTTFFMVNCGFMRSNLYKGPFLHDTSFTLTPFQDKIAVIRKVPYKAAVDISKRGLWDVSVFHEKLLSRSISYEQTSLRSRNFEPNNTNRDQPSVDNKKISTSTNSSTLLRGYITTDDGGSDGDDTLYSHLGAVVKPPPFMTAVTGLPDDGEPEYVDLAFNSFLTSMMLILLQNKGYDFDKSKVEYHSDEQIRDMISMWVKDNWVGNC